MRKLNQELDAKKEEVFRNADKIVVGIGVLRSKRSKESTGSEKVAKVLKRTFIMSISPKKYEPRKYSLESDISVEIADDFVEEAEPPIQTNPKKGNFEKAD